MGHESSLPHKSPLINPTLSQLHTAHTLTSLFIEDTL